MNEPRADVCLLLEGTYPYVQGGVSSWVHQLIKAQSHLEFSILTIMPVGFDLTERYELPDNIISLEPVTLPALPPGEPKLGRRELLFQYMEEPLRQFHASGRIDDLTRLMEVLRPYRRRLGTRLLLDSRQAWDMLVTMYRKGPSDGSFIDFFWSWRAMFGGLFSMLLTEIPPARIYHTISTGYAGVLAARARLETGRPSILTEHGIYTNERRIEIVMSDWLYERPGAGLDLGRSRRNLKDLWIEAFLSYSKACYAACSEIITLYRANQLFQLQDGADPEKLRIIPNGIDVEVFDQIEREADHPPTIALIGRVVPIKDVKTFIRACAILRTQVPDLHVYVMGPTEEDVTYYEECREMVAHLGLGDCLEFTGKVRLHDYLGRIDAIALTSISEAQPLVILEAGAARVPTVATNVGACSELILGRDDEDPNLGPGGAVTPLSNPSATAAELGRLLTDPAWRARCAGAARERVERYYSQKDLDCAYRDLYEKYRYAKDADEPRSAA